jgi:uncharacterized protein (TIGR02246 family)
MAIWMCDDPSPKDITPTAPEVFPNPDSKRKEATNLGAGHTGAQGRAMLRMFPVEDAPMTDTGVKDVFDRYVAAVNASDVDALLALYADDVHVFDMMEPFERHGNDASRELLQAWLGDESVTQECVIEDLHIIENGDLAAARAAVRYGMTMADGTRHSMWNRATWTLQRVNGHWKIVTEHTSVPLGETDMQPRFEAR